MSRTLYLNCASGVSGDMFVGALLHLGADLGTMREAVKALGLGHVRLEDFPVHKGGIAAVSFDVVIPEGTPTLPTPARVHEVVGKSDLPHTWKEGILAVFDRLARAEAEAHGKSPEEVHFHELGSADTIVDVVSAVVGLDSLGVREVLVSPVNTGGGTVRTAHGVFPVPAPATARLLEGFEVFSDGEPGEKTTPTGAALLAALARPVSAVPPMTVLATGYGAGRADFRASLNVLQAILGEPPDGLETESSVVLECNIDDMNPQVYPYLIQRLLAGGAQDAYITQVLMKKGRPGCLVTVVSPPELAVSLGGILLAESTSIGLRQYSVGRLKAPRRSENMETPWGPVRVKIARIGGRDRAVPEFEDCCRVAQAAGLPLQEVLLDLGRLAAARFPEGGEADRDG